MDSNLDADAVVDVDAVVDADADAYANVDVDVAVWDVCVADESLKLIFIQMILFLLLLL